MVDQKLSDSLQLVGQANSIITLLEDSDQFAEQGPDIVSAALCAALHLLTEVEINLVSLSDSSQENTNQ